MFGAEAADDLLSVRETFRRKGYLGRMSALIELLREHGRCDADLLALRVADLAQLRRDPQLAVAAQRFAERRAEFGSSAEPDDRAFTKPDGAPIAAGELRDYLREIRMARRGAEANGEMCRMLLKARQEFPTPPEAVAGAPAS